MSKPFVMSAVLSDEQLSEILRNIADNKHYEWPVTHDVANAAYQFGIERARRVKPLTWNPNGTGHYLWALGELYVVRIYPNGTFGAIYSGIENIGGNYLTEREAKAACQAHHEQFILSNLEPI